MSLSVYSIEQAEQWDKIVRSFAEYDVYYLSGYVRAFQLQGDGEPLLFYYEDGNARGINVVMKRDISEAANFVGKLEKSKYFDFITPYGYGGWLIEGSAASKLFETYESWCRSHNIVTEFVRYHPVLNNHQHSDAAYNVTALGGTITVDLSDPETIWKNFSSQNRNMVRKARKAGIVIYNGRYPSIYEEFRTIYNDTMTRNGAESYYYFKPEFYQSILRDLPAEGQVFYAELNGKVIAASIMLAANGRLNYHLSGSRREYQTLAPTNLLLYEAALWGYANGCKTLHLGGGLGSHEDSLFKFKKAFYRGEPTRFHIGKKTFLAEKYDELMELRKSCSEKPIKENFFPQYRG